MILGRIALEADDVEAAKEYLIAAGKTPGSPQLNTGGPEMLLAEELLSHGEKQVVLDFIELCRNFWESDRGWLDQWKEAIEKDQIPNFDKN